MTGIPETSRSSRFLVQTVGVVVCLFLSTVASSNGKEKAPPTTAQKKQALALLQRTYAKEFHEADTPTRKSALADKLLTAARKSRKDPAQHFVLLGLARDIAILAGDVDLAMKAHRSLIANFNVNDMAMRMPVLEKLSGYVHSIPQQMALANAALDAVDVALESRRFKEAVACVSVASKAAAKGKIPELTALARQRRTEIDQAEVIYDDFQRFRSKLEVDSRDPEANLAVGLYLGLLKRDWSTAVPLLAKGSDAGLRRVAVMELKKSPSGEDLLKQADAWSEIGKKSKGLLRRRSLERASTLYRQAQGKTNGASQDRARQRLADVTQSLRSPDVRPGSSDSRAGTSRRSRKKNEPSPWISHAVRKLRTYPAEGPVFCVAFSPDSSMVAAGTDDNKVYVWDLDSVSPRHKLQDHKTAVRAVAFDPKGKLLASGSHDGTIILWDVKTGKALSTLSSHTRPVNALAFSPDGTVLASASADKTGIVWNVKTGRAIHTLTGHKRSVNGVDFAPDGSRIITSSGDGTLVLWNLATGRALGKVAKHSPGFARCAVSPNGEMVAAATPDRLVLIVPGPNVPPIPLAGHTDGVIGVDFLPDGTTIASSSRDATVRLWDLSGKMAPRILLGAGEPLLSVAFSPNGAYLAAGGDDESVTVWTPNRQ